MRKNKINFKLSQYFKKKKTMAVLKNRFNMNKVMNIVLVQ